MAKSGKRKNYVDDFPLIVYVKWDIVEDEEDPSPFLLTGPSPEAIVSGEELVAVYRLEKVMKVKQKVEILDEQSA